MQEVMCHQCNCGALWGFYLLYVEAFGTRGGGSGSGSVLCCQGNEIFGSEKNLIKTQLSKPRKTIKLSGNVTRVEECVHNVRVHR
jgi:hypothetical protein